MEGSGGTVSILRDRFVRRSALVCLIGLGGFLAWAGLAPLAEGVPAAGQIVVENDRQVVQHLEGGIIHELLVRDGDQVTAGEALLTLQETASLAVRDELLQEIATLTGSQQRLAALREGLEEPDFSPLDTLDLTVDQRQAVMARQSDLFRQQMQSFRADIAVLTARRDGARSSRDLHAQQIRVTQRVIAAAEEQLSLLRERYERQMARLDELRGMERDVAALEADISRLRTDAQQAATLEQDLDGQIAQTEAAFLRQISADQLEVRSQLEQAGERIAAAQDVLNRSVVVAPLSGEVLNLRFATRGGVVRPGEAILEIVPAVGEMTASVRVQPADRAAVYEGQAVRTRLTAYKSWMTPRLDGEVISVSADLKTDQNTGVSYYEVRIRIPADQAARLGELDVIPGMPVEVFIFSGSSRTTLDYLFEPISESLFRGARTG
ncbi:MULTISPECIES: HlyD family type I secretion periplasmic adaptor subunit [Maricaulis]|jgi:HlyD family type I secretion membrane fusion protein|uniref:Membrane fusion protein (MFP) family protein n=1 Tax=Maricaulis maris (strain MCS10) TaxID=394221 RepID=Q0ALR2_MARMM|nr:MULTISPECIES: HlyD family type I secretion periplasmic adaptor subunit [Maricaulis]ABI66781.1 type I secretion membrane fusion protein, HlyD family [Maricaulis maris MCS10]MAC88805.1 HlyD family type I secretion periplasmic adaptor subunit [Maricaulis sp.]